MYKYFLIAVVTFFSFGNVYSQTITETYPKTLYSVNDSITLKFSNYPEAFPYAISKINESPGTDASPGLYATIYFGKDSVRLQYHNKIPYAHIFYVNLQSPKGKSKLRIHFNDLTCLFPQVYMDKHNGSTAFEIPEVYELANIIWTLSPGGQKATDLYKEGPYYERMMAWFKPCMNHPIFKQLSFPDSIYYSKYYDFRENSFAYNFKDTALGAKNTKLLFNGPYYYAYGDKLADSSLFGMLKPLVEDFASKSKFRQFYKQNVAYYNKQIERQHALLPLKKMWSWLEIQFPKKKYQSYKVVSSPLIGGSHSTQRYASPNGDKFFIENVMFVCGTDRYDKLPNLNEKQREGLMTGVVFTEIDHNYVNPTTNKYSKQIDSIFSKRNIWAKAGNGSDYYGSSISVFNEYMTHAAFCLYIADNFDKATAEYVIANRENLMVNRRNFIRFKEFDQELLRLHNERKDLSTADLYPLIMEWCKKQL